MASFECRWRPGDKVLVGDDIPATVERVIFARGTQPMVLVEWWDCGQVRSREFLAEDLTPQEPR